LLGWVFRHCPSSKTPATSASLLLLFSFGQTGEKRLSQRRESSIDSFIEVVSCKRRPLLTL
jgi:hypothetical protein